MGNKEPGDGTPRKISQTILTPHKLNRIDLATHKLNLTNLAAHKLNQTNRERVVPIGNKEPGNFSFFFMTLDKGPRRPLRLEFSGTHNL